MNRYIRKKESGISIVALVITIILLLIFNTGNYRKWTI